MIVYSIIERYINVILIFQGMDTNWKYGDFRKGKVSEVEITPIVRYGKAKPGKNMFYISMTLIKRIILKKIFQILIKTIQS